MTGQQAAHLLIFLLLALSAVVADISALAVAPLIAADIAYRRPKSPLLTLPLIVVGWLGFPNASLLLILGLSLALDRLRLFNGVINVVKGIGAVVKIAWKILPNPIQMRIWLSQLNHEDTDVRREAAFRVGRQANLAAVRPLIRLLDDPDERVRSTAVSSLFDIGKTCSPVAAELMPTASARQRPVLQRLIDLDRPSAEESLEDASAPELIAHLRGSDPELRVAAARALGELQDHAAVPDLIAVLSDVTHDTDVRAASAEALGMLSAAEAVPDLTRALEDEQLEQQARIALHRMGRGGQELLEQLESPPAPEDEYDQPRIRTIRALGALRDPSTVRGLLSVASDPDPEVRAACARALGLLLGEIRDLPDFAEDTAAIEAAMETFYADTEGEVRWAAVQRREVAVDTLIRLASDPFEFVRNEVMWGLKHHGAKAIPLIAKALRDDPDDQVRMHAASAISEIEDVRVVEPLLAALEDPSWRVRGQAAFVLGGMRKRVWRSHRDRVFEAVAKLRNDDDESVRRSAMDALKNLS